MRAAPLALSIALASRAAVADPIATGTACGQPVSVTRNGAGAVTLSVAHGDTVLGTATGAATLETHAITAGSAIVVTVREGEAPALGAVIHCSPHAPPTVAWSGDLRWRGEDIGQRVRNEVVASSAGGASEVLVGARNEAVNLCGVTPLLEARRLDGATGRLVAAAVDPLAGVQATASAVSAAATSVTPFMSLRVRSVLSRGTVVESTRALVDGSAATSLPIARNAVITAVIERGPALFRGLDLTVPAAPATLPRRWTVLAGAQRFDVEIPEAIGHAAGQRVHIPMAGASSASCVVLVPTDADGALAELRPETSLDDVADPYAALAGEADGQHGEEAARLLATFGARGMHALADRLPSFGTIGARRAVRLLDSVRGLPDGDQRAVSSAVVAALSRDDVATAAAEALRHHGAVAMAALTEMVPSNPRASAVVATMPVPVEDRARALSAALDAETEAWTAARGALRNVLPALSREGRAGPWLEALPSSARAQSRGLRAAAESLEAGDAQRATVASRARALWATSDDFDVRYRLLRALAGDEDGRALLREALAHDRDADLRAEAARALRGTERANDALREGLSDAVPRVRAASAAGLAGVGAMRPDLARVLSNDPWPSVRVAAVEALAGDAEASATLVEALGQTSFAVVQSVLVALARTPGGAVTGALVTFADNDRHNPELRAVALESLGARCDASALPALERLASSLSDPSLPPNFQALGHAALAAMARIDPERARQWLTRAEANAQATAAVTRAMRSRCVRQ